MSATCMNCLGSMERKGPEQKCYECLEAELKAAETKLEAMPYVMNADEKIALGRIGQLEEELKAALESRDLFNRSFSDCHKEKTALEAELAEAKFSSDPNKAKITIAEHLKEVAQLKEALKECEMKRLMKPYEVKR